MELVNGTQVVTTCNVYECQNGSRRRTAGGVYLFLVKDDASVTRQQQTVIFYGSAEERKRQQRETKRYRWRHHRDNIAAAKSDTLADDLPALPDCRDLFLRGRLPNGKAEPSSEMAVVTSTDNDIADNAADDDDDDVDDDDVVNIELELV